MTSDLYFRPSPDWVGDVIPFTDGDEIRLYYLYERRRTPKPGTPWHQAVTHDLVHYEDRGEALSAGGVEDEDFNAYTGSIVRDDEGLFHLFYTANNPRRLAPGGRSLQLVAHATSVDARTWVKHPEGTFGAPEGYDPADWRDPYVYRTPDNPGWTMILAARHQDGPDRRRGVVARLTSDDLTCWQIQEPLWDPHRFITQECPEVFRIGQWWYLVYSEFSDRFTTRYRVARSPEGPWLAPERDTIDGRAFYAAKSVEWHGRRLFFGWIASREGASDSGPWLWAGTMAALEAVQNPDGSLALRLPQEVLGAFAQPLDVDHGPARLESRTGYSARMLTDRLPDSARVSLDLAWEEGTREVSVLLRADDSGEEGYVLRLEPLQSRMVLDRWPRREPGTEQWHIAGDQPHFIELERPVDLSAGHAHLDLIMHGELFQCCLNNQVCLSTSIYDHPSGRLGVAVLDGSLVIRSLDVLTRS